MNADEFAHGYGVLRFAYRRALHDGSWPRWEALTHGTPLNTVVELTPLQKAFMETLGDFIRGASEKQVIMVRWANENGWPDYDVVEKYGLA